MWTHSSDASQVERSNDIFRTKKTTLVKDLVTEQEETISSRDVERDVCFLSEQFLDGKIPDSECKIYISAVHPVNMKERFRVE